MNAENKRNVEKRPAMNIENKNVFNRSKLAMSIDYIFGKGASKALSYSELELVYSRRTGRLKYITDRTSNQILFTFRPNGSIAPTVDGAGLLLSKFDLSSKLEKRPQWTVTVVEGVSDLVSAGKTAFCKHIVHCNDSLRAGDDVAILSESGRLLAVGRAILPGPLMKQFKRGPAIKVREGCLKKNAIDEF